MSETLYAPDAEHVATTNAWAFLHWASRCAPGPTPPPSAGWAALIRWSADDPRGFANAIGRFAAPDENLRNQDDSAQGSSGIRARSLAHALLHADLRPDDRVLIATRWEHPDLLGTAFIEAIPDDLLGQAAARRATVLVADPADLSGAAFRHPGPRPDLSALRSIVAIGSPMAPEARARIYAWVKADIMLLAQAGDLLWGSPLDPVPLHPAPPLAFFRA